MENIKSDQMQTHEEDIGFFRLWWRSAREPLFRQQRRVLWGEQQAGLWRELGSAVAYTRAAWRDRRAQKLTETWDSFVRRKGYSTEDLAHALRQALWTHWLMYLLAGGLLVYAYWLALNVGPWRGLLTLTPTVGALVNGYCAGYRAWQVRNRRLITLANALRIAGTYFVL